MVWCHVTFLCLHCHNCILLVPTLGQIHWGREPPLGILKGFGGEGIEGTHPAEGLSGHSHFQVQGENHAMACAYVESCILPSHGIPHWVGWECGMAIGQQIGWLMP